MPEAENSRNTAVAANSLWAHYTSTESFSVWVFTKEFLGKKIAKCCGNDLWNILKKGAVLYIIYWALFVRSIVKL